ncbi:hypothetical protein N9V90_03280 [Endozoicomonas sp.]|nr:hypothetical protein [Endozoicomonas sp.]
MDTQIYLREVADGLKQIFQAEKAGIQTSSKERHRCEGFMRAGTFLGLISTEGMSQLMESVHQEVFGTSIANRARKQKQQWENDTVNYSQFDMPAYERSVKSQKER